MMMYSLTVNFLPGNRNHIFVYITHYILFAQPNWTVIKS